MHEIKQAVPTLQGANVDLSETREIENRHIRVVPYAGAVCPSNELELLFAVALKPADYGYADTDE